MKNKYDNEESWQKVGREEPERDGGRGEGSVCEILIEGLAGLVAQSVVVDSKTVAHSVERKLPTVKLAKKT